jgi:hypothetical protein
MSPLVSSSVCISSSLMYVRTVRFVSVPFPMFARTAFILIIGLITHLSRLHRFCRSRFASAYPSPFNYCSNALYFSMSLSIFPSLSECATVRMACLTSTNCSARFCPSRHTERTRSFCRMAVSGHRSWCLWIPRSIPHRSRRLESLRVRVRIAALFNYNIFVSAKLCLT